MDDMQPWTLEQYFASPLLADVPRERLAAINEDMCREYMVEDHLLTQGQEENALFILSRGAVDIVGNFNGNKQRIAVRSAGDVVGEQSIINGKMPSADVVATQRVSALRIPAAVVNELKSDATFAWNMTRLLSNKLREATESRVANMLEQNLLFAHFRSHVPREFVTELLRKGSKAGSPQRVNAIVMFTDLRDYTKLSEALGDPLAVAEGLAPYFETVVDAIHKAKGIVDKFIGDAVMAVWGHPALETRTADDIFDLVVTLRKQVADLKFAGESVRMGFGIESGSVFMGNVGSEEKRSFTVLGTPVNLAARYESANKAEDGTVFAATFGPSFYASLSENRRATLVTRENVPIKGASGDRQTVYSMKDE